MSFIRSKKIKGHVYYYEVEIYREDKKVKQRIIKYLGTTPTKQNVVPN